MWIQYPGFKALIKEVCQVPNHGNDINRVVSKLRDVKAALMVWNTNVYGDVNFAIKASLDSISLIQSQFEVEGFSEDLFHEESVALAHLEDLLGKQGEMLKEKCHTQWQMQGDRNTIFFSIRF